MAIRQLTNDEKELYIRACVTQQHIIPIGPPCPQIPVSMTFYDLACISKTSR